MTCTIGKLNRSTDPSFGLSFYTNRLKSFLQMRFLTQITDGKYPAKNQVIDWKINSLLEMKNDHGMKPYTEKSMDIWFILTPFCSILTPISSILNHFALCIPSFQTFYFWLYVCRIKVWRRKQLFFASFITLIAQITVFCQVCQSQTSLKTCLFCVIWHLDAGVVLLKNPWIKG